MTTPSQLPTRDNDGTRPLIPPHVLCGLMTRLFWKEFEDTKHQEKSPPPGASGDEHKHQQ